MLTMDALDLTNKRVLIREDLNVPMADGKISNDARIRAAIPTLKKALQANARVMVMSHLGRPTEGIVDTKYSLQAVAQRLSELLDMPMPLITDWQNPTLPAAGEIVLFENVRFLKGEKANDEQLAQHIASLCDIYVMDAFATAHRAQASTHGVARFAPTVCAGPLLLNEITTLDAALQSPQRPTIAIVGGAKVSSKLTVLENLCKKVDTLILGGGIANTFLAATGHPIGQSLFEPELIETAKHILEQAKQNNCSIPLAKDVVVANEFSASAQAIEKSIDDVATDELILDIGPQTITDYQTLIAKANTVLWNGPVGVFEFESFSHGSRAIANSIASSDAFSIAGGGDTLAAIEQFDVQSDISYISTGGGAFLEMLAGKPLPVIEILALRAKQPSPSMESSRE